MLNLEGLCDMLHYVYCTGGRAPVSKAESSAFKLLDLLTRVVPPQEPVIGSVCLRYHTLEEHLRDVASHHHWISSHACEHSGEVLEQIGSWKDAIIKGLLSFPLSSTVEDRPYF